MFENMSTKELEEELARRQEAEIPKLIANPDLGFLREACQEYINTVAKGDLIDQDFDTHLSETAVETMFGKGVWEFVNSKLK